MCNLNQVLLDFYPDRPCTRSDFRCTSSALGQWGRGPFATVARREHVELYIFNASGWDRVKEYVGIPAEADRCEEKSLRWVCSICPPMPNAYGPTNLDTCSFSHTQNWPTR